MGASVKWGLNGMVKSLEYAVPKADPVQFVAIGDKKSADYDSISVNAPPHAVIIIENMTAPADRRVWQQALALKEDGWQVSIIAPKLGAYREARETIQGVDIYRHDLPLQANTIAAFALEYGWALASEMERLVHIGLGTIDVVQICNPPDFLFAPALLAKVFGNAKVVFDHHDLTPELLVEKTGRDSGMLLSFARWAERMTFRTADQVISTNTGFRQRAIELGGKAPRDVSVVYSTPDTNNLPTGVETPSLKRGKDILLFWVGIIGSQDGVDLLLDAIAHLRALPGGDRFHLAIAGDGPERASLEEKASAMGLDDVVSFKGFVYGQDLANAFVTADIGLGSDPKNAFNDRLAMNKTFEYMTYSLPIVMFDLDESRRIAGDAAIYVGENDPAALANSISNLIDSPAKQSAMGTRGHQRLQEYYSWSAQKEKYLDVYRNLIATP